MQLNKADFEKICSDIESGELESSCAVQALQQAACAVNDEREVLRQQLADALAGKIPSPQKAPAAVSTVRPRPPGMALPEEVTPEMKAMQWKEPQKWSLTMRQFCTVVEHCMTLPEYVALKKQKRFVTMYDLCNIFVKSWSAGTGKCCEMLVLYNSITG